MLDDYDIVFFLKKEIDFELYWERFGGESTLPQSCH